VRRALGFELRIDGRLLHGFVEFAESEGASATGDLNDDVRIIVYRSVRELIINAVKHLGFRWLKQQIEWKHYEPAKGQYQWGEMDRLVESCQAAGIKLPFSVVKAPKWARPVTPKHTIPSRIKSAVEGILAMLSW